MQLSHLLFDVSEIFHRGNLWFNSPCAHGIQYKYYSFAWFYFSSAIFQFARKYPGQIETTQITVYNLFSYSFHNILFFKSGLDEKNLQTLFSLIDASV